MPSGDQVGLAPLLTSAFHGAQNGSTKVVLPRACSAISDASACIVM
jgi:hypothetical protein